MAASEAIARLGVDPERGLSSEEAVRRLERWGPNVLPEARPTPWHRRLLEQFTQFLVVVLLLAAGVSLALGEWLDALAILGIVVLNGLLGFVQEFRAERALQALRSMAAPAATVLRDGQVARVPADRVVPGDILCLADGDVVAADGRLIEAAGLRLNEAVLTGESAPVDKTTDPLPDDTDLAERRCMVYQGGLVVRGRGVAVVVATGLHTEMGRVAASMQRQPERGTPLQRRLADMGRWLVYGAGSLCALVFFIGVLRGLPAGDMFLTATSLAVAAIPEGLPAATTIVLALGVQRMARRNAIVRRLAAVETLGSVTVVCADKTGTLTQNRMEVMELWLDGRQISVGAAGETIRSDTLGEALRTGVLCNDASPGPKPGEAVGDPTEVALLELAVRFGVSPDDERRAAPRELEIPFEARRARMTVVCREAGSRVAHMKGAPEVVVPLCASIREGGRTRPFSEEDRRRVLDVAAEMAERGMRVLALARRRLADSEPLETLERDFTLLALVGMADALRPEAAPSIQMAMNAGVRVLMLTGDHPVTARAIAREIGLPVDRIVLGRDIEELPDEDLQRAVEGAAVFARVSSEHKLRIVETLRRSGAITAMTGDGVNDAPALRAADIGVAMGQGGTDVAREASDIVLVDNNIRSIVAAIEEGRRIYDNIRNCVHYLLTCNLSEVVVVFLVLAIRGDTPLLPLQILFVNLLTDGLPALALGVEPADPDVMRRPPRPPRAGILSVRSLAPIFGIGLFVAAPTILAYEWGRLIGDEDLGRDLAFATLVGTQLAASFEFRSPTQPLYRLRTNLWLLLAVATSAGLLFVVFHAPPLQPAFRTEALPWEQWLGVAGLSLAPLVITELVKLTPLGLWLAGSREIRAA
ncbi:MAG TPA: cation-translocating P-type ATPase [Dehalococcoidia bacterium]|nr:cation-translocating P-type ATPase [Dehalococcoidia bacterium]